MSAAEFLGPSLKGIAEQFRAEIFAYIRGKIGDAATADDLTQETFVKVGAALANGTEPEHFRGWLFQIARNVVFDYLKQTPRFVPFEESHVLGKSDNTDAVDDEFRKYLFSYALRVIETLPTEDREALTLTEIDGLSREELASQLGISLTAAKSRVHRARVKLRKAIEECCRLVTDPYGRVIDWKKRGKPCCGPDKSANRQGSRPN